MAGPIHLRGWLLVHATVVGLAATPAAARLDIDVVCLDRGSLDAWAERRGMRETVRARSPNPIGPNLRWSLHLSPDGRWSLSYSGIDGLWCPIVGGDQWRPQGEIPPSDLRPGG